MNDIHENESEQKNGEKNKPIIFPQKETLVPSARGN
jgi:hypothetical protein